MGEELRLSPNGFGSTSSSSGVITIGSRSNLQSHTQDLNVSPQKNREPYGGKSIPTSSMMYKDTTAECMY